MCSPGVADKSAKFPARGQRCESIFALQDDVRAASRSSIHPGIGFRIEFCDRAAWSLRWRPQAFHPAETKTALTWLRVRCARPYWEMISGMLRAPAEASDSTCSIPL